MKCTANDGPYVLNSNDKLENIASFHFSFTHARSPLGGGGGLSYKDGECSSEILTRTLRGVKILFCGRGLKSFAPLRGTKILFCGRDLKSFFTPKRYKDPVL